MGSRKPAGPICPGFVIGLMDRQTHSRRAFLGRAGLLLAAGRGLRAASLFVTAETTTGKVQGMLLGGIHTFKGIPYGASSAALTVSCPRSSLRRGRACTILMAAGVCRERHPGPSGRQGFRPRCLDATRETQGRPWVLRNDRDGPGEKLPRGDRHNLWSLTSST